MSQFKYYKNQFKSLYRSNKLVRFSQNNLTFVKMRHDIADKKVTVSRLDAYISVINLQINKNNKTFLTFSECR